jgi:hypothetical protein
MERRLRNHGEAMRKKPRSTRRPSEEHSDERLDRLVGRSRYAAEKKKGVHV